MSIFRRKSIKELKAEISKSNLKKELTAIDLLLLGLGGIIGTGIFVLTGLAAAQYAGPAITLSFLLGAVACIFTALAYCEMASMLPVAGGAYTYAYVSMGEIAAMIIGWTMLMVFNFGGATVAAGWSGYVLGIFESFGMHLSPELTKIPSQGGWINLPATFIVLFLTFLLYRGTKEATRLNNILVAVKLITIFIFIYTAVPHVNTALYWKEFSPNGFFGIAAGAGFVFMAYTGFDTLANAAEECKTPNRDLPIGIIGSLLTSAVLYIIVAGLMTSIIHYSQLNNAEPMAVALRSNGVNMAAKIVATGAILAMPTVILTLIYGQSRLILAFPRDGLIPSFLNRVHSRFVTPNRAVLLGGFITALIAGFIPVGTLGQLSSMSTLVVFSSVSLGVMIMRFRAPQENRPFTCPSVYVVASLSLLMCGFLFLQLFVVNWQAYLISMTLGLILYFSFGYRSSKLQSPELAAQVQPISKGGIVA